MNVLIIHPTDSPGKTTSGVGFILYLKIKPWFTTKIVPSVVECWLLTIRISLSLIGPDCVHPDSNLPVRDPVRELEPAGHHQAARGQLRLQLGLELCHHLLHTEDDDIVVLLGVMSPQVLSYKTRGGPYTLSPCWPPDSRNIYSSKDKICPKTP